MCFCISIGFFFLVDWGIDSFLLPRSQCWSTWIVDLMPKRINKDWDQFFFHLRERLQLDVLREGHLFLYLWLETRNLEFTTSSWILIYDAQGHQEPVKLQLTRVLGEKAKECLSVQLDGVHTFGLMTLVQHLCICTQGVSLLLP